MPACTWIRFGVGRIDDVLNELAHRFVTHDCGDDGEALLGMLSIGTVGSRE
jgi:hypothetical protein